MVRRLRQRSPPRLIAGTLRDGIERRKGLSTAIGVSLGISVLVALDKFRFVGRTSLAFVLIAIAAVPIVHGVVLWRLLEGE